MLLPVDSAALFARIPADGSSTGNQKLREELGWDEERYPTAEAPERGVARGKCWSFS